MNAEKFAQFSEAYTAALTDVVSMFPQHYAIKADETAEAYAARVAAKILAAIAAGRHAEVSYTGTGFKKACTMLSIKHTRKAIFEFLGIGS